MAGGILDPQPGMEPLPSALEVQSPNYWTAGECQKEISLKELFIVIPRLMGFSAVKNPPASLGAAGDTGLIPGWEIFSGGGNGNSLQCSCWDNPMDRGTWWLTVHGLQRIRHN